MAKKEIVVLRETKDIVLVSFSGGETSAMMLIDVLQENEKQATPKKIIVLFFNTGEETEETLIFVHQVDQYIQHNYKHIVEWVQYDGYDPLKKRHKHLKVTYYTAYRSHDPEEIKALWPNHPFRKMIEYFGIPNRMYKHCTRELKSELCKRYMRAKYNLDESDYTIATGIRADEIDRLTSNRWHPLALKGITKPHVNTFWKNMPFRLMIAGWEGNCKVCWKKSDRKLCTLYRHHPERFSFFDQMQKEYEWHEPKRTGKRQRKKLESALRFFRGNKTVEDIAELAKGDFPDAEDDSIVYVEGLDDTNGCEESCEPF